MLRVVITSIIVYLLSQFMIVGDVNVIPRKKEYILYNILSVFCLYSFFNMFLWNYKINFLIVITIFFVLTLAMYYVHEFRGTNVNFSDILSLNTAKEVAGGYSYQIKKVFIICGIVIIFEYIFQIPIIKNNVFENYHKAINNIESENIDLYRFLWHEVAQVLCFFISFFVLRDKVSDSKYDYSLCAGENEGYIYNFISSIPLFHKVDFNYKKALYVAKQFIIDVCKSYDSKSKKGLPATYIDMQNKYKNYATNTKDAPHIIVIMNESFGTVHRRISTNLPITPYYDSMKNVIKGNLYVNTFGGGTANTEFEFLTGMTIGNYPYPVMPYNNFVKRDKYSIAKLFNNLGYETIAMHPYTATNYHRDKVYKKFGFNELLFINDFKEKHYVRKFVSDASMYREVVRKYNEIKLQNKKSFIFGITMQNHSGYEKFEGAEALSYMVNYKNRTSLDSYLSLMRISDASIEKLINYFNNEDERVIVLFFGDHNASFGNELNKVLYDTNIEYECTNAYETPFFIYDNKFPEEKFIDGISANFLSLELLKKANLPFDALHNLLNEIYEQYPIYNFHKMKVRKSNILNNISNDKFMTLEREYLK